MSSHGGWASVDHQHADMPAGTGGAGTMCIGVGQGIVTLVERV